MSQPTWADFVRWAADDASAPAASQVRTAEGARVFFACRGNSAATYERVLGSFTAKHGAPVDPPHPLLERLLSLLDDVKKEAAASEVIQSGELRYSDECAALYSVWTRLRAAIHGLPVEPACRIVWKNPEAEALFRSVRPVPRAALVALAEELKRDAAANADVAVKLSVGDLATRRTGQVDGLRAAESRLRAILETP